jgi:hypothetical protein
LVNLLSNLNEEIYKEIFSQSKNRKNFYEVFEEILIKVNITAEKIKEINLVEDFETFFYFYRENKQKNYIIIVSGFYKKKIFKQKLSKNLFVI